MDLSDNLFSFSIRTKLIVFVTYEYMMAVNQKSAKLFNFRCVFLLPCVVSETICDHIMGLIAWIRDNKPVTIQPIRAVFT